MLVAAEASGDALGAELAAALKRRLGRVRFVGGFVGSPPMNILAGAVSESEGELSVATVAGRVVLPAVEAALVRQLSLESVLLGVRPEDLSVDHDGDLAATVSLIESMGRLQHVTCRLADGHLISVQGAEHVALDVGDHIALSVCGPLHLFDPVTERRLS